MSAHLKTRPPNQDPPTPPRPAPARRLKPIIDAFSGSADLNFGSTSLTGTAHGTAMAFHGASIGTDAYLVECLVSLALDYGGNKGWIQLFAPSPAAGGLKQPRCLLAEAQNGQGNAQLSVTSDLNATACAVKRRTLNGTSANVISVTGFSTAGTAITTTFEEHCAAIYNVNGALAPFAFEGAYTHPGSGNAVKVLVSNTSVLMHVRNASLTPVQDSYAKASCVRAAAVLNSTDEAVLANGDNRCMYIKMRPAAGVLQVTDFIANCSISSFAYAKAVAGSTRVSGRFLALPPAAGPAAAAPPPPASAVAVQVVPVATFTQTFTMPADKGSDDLAINLMTPCAVASIRAAYAASLGVPMASVVLSTFTFADSTPAVSLSPTDAGNLASGLCAGLRRLAVAAGGAGARALPGATSTVTASTTIANPSAAATLTVAAGFTIIVAGVGSSASTGASSAPVLSTQALLQPVPLITRLTPYVPSDLIKSAHALPRGKDSTNDFSLAGLSDMSGMMKCAQSLGAKDSCPNTYIFGAIAPGVGLIAAGIVFLIVWIFAYGIACCSSCCRTKCCPKRDRSAGGKFERCAKVLPIVRAVLGVITCALVLGGLGSVQKFPGGLTAVTGLVNSFSNTIASLVVLLDPATPATPVPLSLLDGTVISLVSPMAAVSAAANDFTTVKGLVNTPAYPACPGSGTLTSHCTQATVATLISALATALHTAATSGGSIGKASTALAGVQTTITNSLGSISLKGLETQITMYASAALGVIAAIIIFQAVLVCRTFLACCAFKSLCVCVWTPAPLLRAPLTPPPTSLPYIAARLFRLSSTLLSSF